LGLWCCAIHNGVTEQVDPDISSQRSGVKTSGIIYPVMQHCIPAEQNLCVPLFTLIYVVCNAATEQGDG
jgi:hypothetical protein